MITNIKSAATRFIREEDGATMVEYVLLVALIGIVAIVAMRAVGTAASSKLANASSNLQ